MSFNLCFLLSQRVGLLFWTYIKLITPLVFTIYMFITQQELIRIFELLVVVIIFVLVIDAIFNILCVIGCHTKNPALLRICNCYNIGVLILSLLTMMYFIRTATDFPISLCACISQVYVVCLTENVISELKYEIRRKNVRVVILQPKGKLTDIIRNRQDSANELVVWCDDDDLSTNSSLV